MSTSTSQHSSVAQVLLPLLLHSCLPDGSEGFSSLATLLTLTGGGGSNNPSQPHLYNKVPEKFQLPREEELLGPFDPPEVVSVRLRPSEICMLSPLHTYDVQKYDCDCKDLMEDLLVC